MWNVKEFYYDNARELISSARKVRWGCPTATSGIPQTNGEAERGVRKVKDGARSLLAQSGLHAKWWRDHAAKAWCVGHNTTTGEDGLTPY